ncbi:MAG: hypothetical protein K2G58_00455, partial [Alistipes sp.]|nr:hypothetical protein [Alistipes sp.]
DRAFDFCHNALIDIFYDKYRIFSEEKQTFFTIQRACSFSKIDRQPTINEFRKCNDFNINSPCQIDLWQGLNIIHSTISPSKAFP